MPAPDAWNPDQYARFRDQRRLPWDDLAALLAPRDQLAVQVPINEVHPSHPEALFRLGFSEQRVRVEVYGRPLASRDEVVEWVRGTLLTDHEKRLPPALWPAFLVRYRQRLATALADQRPFLHTHRCLLLWASRA